MRYFKYSDPWPEIENEKERYNRMQHDMARITRRRNKLGNVVFWFVFVLCTVVSIWHWCIILDFGEGVLELFICAIDFVPIVFMSIILSAILGVIVASLFWDAKGQACRMKLQQIMQRTTEHLRSFYQLNEPCVVTKCYRCSDRKWDRHDICLFIVADELCITTNLKHGFFHPYKDLGCYCLSRQEITWKDGQFRELPALELEADGVSFLISRNAISIIRSFIEAE